MRVLGLIPILLATTACSGGTNTNGTYILVDIDRHNIIGDVIYSFDTTLTIDGHPAVMHTFPEAANGAITKNDPTFTFELDGALTGTAHLIVNARDKTNAFLSSGTGMVQIEPEATANLTIVLAPPSADHLTIMPSKIEVAAGVGLPQPLLFTLMNPTTLATESPLGASGLTSPPFATPTASCLGAALAAGDTCMLQSSFDPGTQTEDVHSYAVQITTPRASLASAAVVARKLNAPITMDHAEFDDFSATMPTKIVVIKNPSNTTPVNFTATVGAGFTASGCGDGSTFTLAAPSGCALTVTFTAGSATTSTLTLTTTTPSATTTSIALMGT